MIRVLGYILIALSLIVGCSAFFASGTFAPAEIRNQAFVLCWLPFGGLLLGIFPVKFEDFFFEWRFKRDEAELRRREDREIEEWINKPPSY